MKLAGILLLGVVVAGGAMGQSCMRRGAKPEKAAREVAASAAGLGEASGTEVNLRGRE